MLTLTSIILASFSIVACVFVAFLALSFWKEKIPKLLIWLISFSAGILMGNAFLHLLPEAIKSGIGNNVWLIVLSAFVFFLLLEKILHWQHCHEENCQIHAFGYLNLIGNGIHDFIDGLIIAAAFMVNIELGIATTFAIALHEIPQEIGNFGILLYAGFKKKTALIMNMLSASVVILGGITGYFILEHLENILPYLLAFAAGGFIYVSASDLVPEIKKEGIKKNSVLPSILFILGIALMAILKD